MRNVLPRRHPFTPGTLLERLECRTLLSWNNFPNVADLLNSNDTVVRLQTNFGDVDFELFDQAAPATVANFLNYIRDGDYDKTFFHRIARDLQNHPFVLQGGAYRLHGPATAGPFNGPSAETQAWEGIPLGPSITNEYNQSNLARTVAMARTSGQVNSATSQFYINLQDNQFLDTVDGGFTVFGRVATDASWAVVQTIINGTTQSDQGGAFAELPTRNASGFNGTDVTEEQLVTIRDAEIIKAHGAGYYNYRVYYPEGFAGSNINEFLPLGNPSDGMVQYQVIARAENRDPLPGDGSDFWYRDKVIATGLIGADRRAGITISTFSNPGNNLVPRQGKPYAIEVWATSALSATLSHYDFGASAIENFTESPATAWTIPDIRRGQDIRDFVVWGNVGETSANITLSFYSEAGGAPIVINTTTEAFRRGGISIGDASQLGDGNYSLQITSDRPLVAAVSHYKTAGADTGGATQLGIAGSGARSGVLPLAYSVDADSGLADTITFFNPDAGGAAAAITLIAKFADGSPDFSWSPAALNIVGGGRASYVLEDLEALRNKPFTLLFSSTASVFASTLHVEHFDVATSAFAFSASTRYGFGEGFMNRNRAGDDLFETLAIYNPNGSPLFSGTVQPAVVTVRFLFTDGFVVSQQFAIDSDKTLIIDLTTFAPLLNQSDHNRFYYSIDVESDVAVVAGMSHYDTSLGGLQPSGGDLSNGTPQGEVVPLNDLNHAPLWLQLRIVPQTGGFGTGTPLSLAGPVNGPVSLGTTPATRTMRFRVDYRIQDLDLTDNIHPAGLLATQLNITGLGAGNTSDTTVSRGTISSYENSPGASPPPGPTNSGLTGNTGNDTTNAEPHGRAGLVGPFRSGMPDQNDNNFVGNGTIAGLSINNINPLTLAQFSQGLIGYDDTSGNPAFPLTGDEWYPLYVFMIVAGDTSSGSVTFTASLPPDPSTRSAFGYFNDGITGVRTSRVAFGASITVNIPHVTG